jgi:hypothetical protein
MRNWDVGLGMVGPVKSQGNVIALEVVFISGWGYTHKGSVRAER